MRLNLGDHVGDDPVLVQVGAVPVRCGIGLRRLDGRW
jgi:hypothetical protein